MKRIPLMSVSKLRLGEGGIHPQCWEDSGVRLGGYPQLDYTRGGMLEFGPELKLDFFL